jgi:hypothetical protein
LIAEVETIPLPEPRAVLRRARRRHTTAAVAALMIVLATGAIVVRSNTTHGRVTVSHPAADLPAGTVVDGQWAVVPKQTSGIGAGTTLHAIGSHGETMWLGGERPGGRGMVVTMWRSTDGYRWTEVEHPEVHDSLSAIAAHDNTVLAVGAPGGPNAFVWRSVDDGRTWTSIAAGPVFGATQPNNRPGAFVSNLVWYDGWWVASGGAADGYEGIWISRDGTRWQPVLDSQRAGGIDALAVLPDGSIAAYGVPQGDTSTTEAAWVTRDPTNWGAMKPVSTPPGTALLTVASGGLLATGERVDPHDLRLLRSSDGMSWIADDALPGATVWSVRRAAGYYVASGVTSAPSRTGVWVSGDGATWVAPPATFPATQRSDANAAGAPPRDAFGLVGAIGARIVMLDVSGDVDQIYVFDPGRAP